MKVLIESLRLFKRKGNKFRYDMYSKHKPKELREDLDDK
jgi:hypothetical protein